MRRKSEKISRERERSPHLLTAQPEKTEPVVPKREANSVNDVQREVQAEVGSGQVEKLDSSDRRCGTFSHQEGAAQPTVQGAERQQDKK